MMATDRTTADVVQALDRLFSKRLDKRDVSPAESAQSQLRAAAVLHLFTPQALQPFDAAPGSDAPRREPGEIQHYAQLFAQSSSAIGWRNTGFRTLKQEARAQALRELGDRGAMRMALLANPDREPTAVQRLIDAWLLGPPIDLQGMSYADLECLGQLYEWGMDAYGGLPDRQIFNAHRARRSAFAVFEHLVDAHFVGRQSELQILRDHVGVVSPSIWSRVRSFLSSAEQAPLVIWGPGGTGKTALIGRFLLEHVDSQASGWFPFAYLPFDSETLNVDEPFTLLIEAAAQFYRQIAQSEPKGVSSTTGELQSAFSAFQAQVGSFRDRKTRLSSRTYQTPNAAARGDDSRLTDQDLYLAFASLLRAVAAAASAQQDATAMPVLLVFDTFEEVQHRTREELSGLWRMLGILQREFTGLRIVISGRGEPALFLVGGKKPMVHALDDLDEKDGVELLRHLGMTDEGAALAVVKQVGCNPLTLRLAARVAVGEAVTAKGLVGIQSRRFLILKLAPELIRGQLYRRVLDHIHDHDVRELAHPGMVLRRVTPQIIQEVLAPICKLKNVDKARAEKLFDALRSEHALVRLDDDNSLRYREEVRRPMLELMLNDKPAQVREIHQRIIDYYRGREPIVAERAEEIYHGMMLGAEPALMDSRWMNGVERYLAPAIEEVAATQRIWLASHMSIQLSPDVYAQASTQEWERIYGRRVASALRYEGPAAALALLGERGERTPQSALYAFEARALIALERAEEAARLIDQALAAYPPVGNQGRLAELLWLRAQAAQWMGQPADALEWLQRLLPVAESLRSGLPLVQTLAEILSPRMPLTVEGRAAFSHQLADAMDRLDASQIDTERAMIRLALVRLEPGYGALLGRLAPQVLGEFRHALQSGLIDMAPVLDHFRELSRQIKTPFSINDPGTNDSMLWLANAAENLIGNLRGPLPDQMAAEALRCLMQAEQVTLLSATLAGLEEYREPWELTIHAEVSV